ncbi:phosphopantetheine-binding protein [Alkalimonas sp.]|uniref:acyl carrier protein n=1 Tax=Alkalimonas sp. TaxID=1872453 RepID=UPI002A1AFBF5|nr:acyl carrier protein [Alkalimonas sp.]
MDLKTHIQKTLREVAELANCQISEPLTDDTVLLESGLDSLGFAMLVAQLEEELGMDPFSEMQIAVYPRTLGEFIHIYQQAAG